MKINETSLLVTLETHFGAWHFDVLALCRKPNDRMTEWVYDEVIEVIKSLKQKHTFSSAGWALSLVLETSYMILLILRDISDI